jgi:hypothetical protein
MYSFVVLKGPSSFIRFDFGKKLTRNDWGGVTLDRNLDVRRGEITNNLKKKR